MEYKIGDVLNHYTLNKIETINTGKRNRTYCFFNCVCGKKRKILTCDIKRRLKEHCGCLNPPPKPKKKPSKMYMVWCSMRYRCEKPNHHNYHNYGGRGIKVCDRWQVFTNFLEDMGERPQGTSLDRIDNSKGYSKENCRWANNFEQANNTRKNVFVEYQGQKYTQNQLARLLGVTNNTIKRKFRSTK